MPRVLLGALVCLAALTCMCAASYMRELPPMVGRTLTDAETAEVISRNSALTDYVYLSPRAEFPRTGKVEKITVHNMQADLTLEEAGEIYSRADRTASSNYVIDSQGRIGLYVEEENASHSSGNRKNDNEAVNITVANDEMGADWHVSDAAYESLVLLVTDICIRNGIEEFTYTGDESGTLTLHGMFRDTSCPGKYLADRVADLVQDVNEMLQMWEEDS